ncbi:MAG: hypothetical protein P1U89_15805 [Verrucomicrobiales bacterium]|nr:hypothetical protein [Verrucomicrobiales bacterium]
MKLPRLSRNTDPKPAKVHNIHWTAIGGFWVGVAGILVALVFGVLSLSNQRGGFKGRSDGWKSKKPSSHMSGSHQVKNDHRSSRSSHKHP